MTLLPPALRAAIATLAMIGGTTFADTAYAQDADGLETFSSMPELTVPIVDTGRVDGVLRLSLTFQTKSQADASGLSKQMPQLRSIALGEAMEFARLYASPMTPVNVHKLIEMIEPKLKSADPRIVKVLIVKVSSGVY